MAEDWAADVKKYVSDPDAKAIAGIVHYCGIALQKRDSSLVSFGDKDEVERWKQHGPLIRLTEWMTDNGMLHESDLAAIETAVAAEMDDAVAFAEAGTWEPVEDLTRFVLAETAAGAAS